MKKIFSLLTAVLFAGAMMATDVAVTIYASSGDYYAKANSWTNGTQYDQVVLDENITANLIGTGNNGKYYSDWRFYTNGSESGSFSIDAAEGYELQTVTFTYTVSNSGALYMGETKLTSKTAVEVSGQKAVFQCKNTNTNTNGQVRITAIAVTYQAAVTPPVATTMTVYCKNVQSWWTADGAAVGVHYWGGASAGTAWPGVRMAPVAGQEGLWSYDVPADITGLIFVRVNGSGDVSDWGAKTADLTLPTDGKNLYTITSTSAVWGDPGVTGEWSVYGDDPTPVDPPTPTLENGFYLIGQKGWDAAALDASLKFAANPDNENEYVLTTTLVKDQHLKVVKVENDALVAWYPDGTNNDYIVDDAHAGENKDIYFQETYKADWAEFGGYFWTGSNEPAGCNWDAIEFFNTGIAPEDENFNQFKICKTGEQPNVVNIQIAPWADNNKGIYINFPSAAFGAISLPAGTYTVQGAGILLHLSAFSALETEVTIEWESNPIVFTVYNAKGGVTPPPTGVEIRLVPTIWNVDGAKFAAVTWKVGEVMESSAAVLTDWFVGGDTVVGYIPADADSIAFARFAAGTATPSLDMSTIWNHSDKLAIDPSMIYTITAWGKEYSPGYWGEAPQPVEAEWFLAGDMTDWQNGKLSFKNGDIKVTLADAGRTYGFKIIKVEGENMTWYGNNGTMTREYNQDWVFDSNEQENGKLTTDVAGEYTFKLVVDGIGMPHVSVTYPNGTGMQLINADDAAVKSMLNGQVVIIRGEHIYTPAGQMIK
ncbi:MAG: hypothetical protein IKD12_00025 [Paludibacteraceae bacterium]|nr:hypothetical protein [Paludibacteraceae bacterium]